MTNAAIPYRAPVTYKVTGHTPMRIAGQSLTPYLIINLESSGGFIWLADNPGLVPRLGTPLAPGGSVTWTKPSDIWAICEPDESCEVVVTTDIVEWTAGSSVEQNTEVALTANDMALPTSGLSLNTAGYRSIHVDIEFDAPDRYVLMEFRRPNSNQRMRRMVIRSGFRTAATQGGLWRATIPTRGANAFFSTNVAGAKLTVVGSFRETDRISQDIIDASVVARPDNGNYLWQDRNLTILAAGSLAVDLNPFIGPITADVVFLSTAVMGTSFARWLRNQSGVPTTFRYEALVADPAANQFAVTSEVPCNGDAYRFEIVNNTAVSFTALALTIQPSYGVGT